MIKLVSNNGYIIQQETKDLVELVNSAFFQQLNITIEFRHSLKKVYGNVLLGINLVMVNLRYFETLEKLHHTILHELGHIYHYRYEREDYNVKTDYGHEIYAESFVEVCLPEYTPNNHFPNYKGYSKKQVYKEILPKIVYTQNYHSGTMKAIVAGYELTIYSEEVYNTDTRSKYGYKMMYRIEIIGNGKIWRNDKLTKLETAKKNIARQLKKWGIDIIQKTML